jgi:tRNA-2-methylthio-N6-dimethylallyladenosine synthase
MTETEQHTSDSELQTGPLSRQVYLETFGCQMNVLDSELIKDQLSALGYQFVEHADNADVVLYNTCSVRDQAEHKVVSRLGRMRQRKEKQPDLIVGMLGCMAERTGQEVAKSFPALDLMCGPSELDRLPMLLENLYTQEARRGAPEMQFALSGHNSRRSQTRDLAMDRLEAMDQGRVVESGKQSFQAYVRITRGCNKFCAFCVVPYTRGPEVHRSPDAIVQEVRKLVDNGTKEVTLLGQTINHYNADDTNFAQLLRRIHDEVPDLPRLRFLTSYPRDFSDEALDVMASSPRICGFLHIPAQHGNNRVLKKMNRGYTKEEYLSLIHRARTRMADISIVGDMIVGFPTESDDEFEDSLELLREVRHKNVFVFKYSPRPGTVTHRKDEDDIPEAVKKHRNNRMLEVQQEISLAHHESMVGRQFDVLVEGQAKIDPRKPRRTPSENAHSESGAPGGLVHIGGKKSAAASNQAPKENDSVWLTSRTTGDHIVTFAGHENQIGQIVTIRVIQASALSLRGELA